MDKSELGAADFSYLESLHDRYASGPAGNQISFFVEGISCGSCVRRIEGMAGRLPGLLEMRVDLPKKIARAEIDPARTNFSAVAHAVRDLGFRPVPLAAGMDGSELEKREARRELIRLAVAGACAGNIMTFAFATYFGAAGSWAPLFAWLSFVLYLPVVTFVAMPFYRGALRALKQGRLAIDLPMAVASFAGFVFSTWGLIQGRLENVYFDSLSGFLFLILISRWAQRGLQKRFLEPRDILETLQLQKVRVAEHGAWRWQALEHTGPGTEIVVARGETVPAECELKSAAHFSLAFLSGENAARKFLAGSRVPAGARLIGDEARMTVIKPLEQTPFGDLLRRTREYSLENVHTVQISDRWAQWLLGIVFAVAIAFLAGYWSESPSEAVRRSLALIILACPCAMAFGTPLAIAAAIRKCHRHGILVRDGGVFERVTRVKTIFFDKTGTLTDADLSLIDPVSEIPQSRQQVILALELHSHHPIAFAFRKAFPYPGPLPPVQESRETAGVGVEGTIGGRRYRLTKAEGESGLACRLEEDGGEIQRFHFAAKLKEGSVETVRELKSRGIEVCLISGDLDEVAQTIGGSLGFEPSRVRGGLSPADKEALVAATPNAMMIGDGINDAPALMKASVAVAASGGVEAALKTSGVMLTAPSLHAVNDLVGISREAYRRIRRNLMTSAVYNAAAGTLALMGYVNPFVAALLMPASSGLLLLTTWWGGRK